MSTQIFDGRAFAQQKEEQLILQVRAIAKTVKRKPKLVAVGINAEKDVAMYLAMKEKAAKRLGIDFEGKIFPDGVEEKEVLNYVSTKNSEESVDGILLELPIPRKYSVTAIMEQISPKKDPDCMTCENLGRLLYGKAKILPATVKAIADILYSSLNPMYHRNEAKPLAFKNAVVIGGGVELGKPLVLILSDLGASVSLCRSHTRDLSEFTKNADLIVSAVGKPNLVTGEMVKEEVMVIDAGINLINGKTAGDVDFESVSKKASFITPVPGGVGPVTIVSLFDNLLELIKSPK